jgi:Flp pilus assembly protein TadG
MSAPARRRLLRGEQGSVSLLFVVVAVGLLAMAGLVVDGGGKARAAAEADDTARATARAAVQAIDPAAVLSGATPATDPARAAAAARAYLAAAGVSGTVSVAPGGRQLTVTTTGSYTPVLLSAVGVGPMQVTGSATADLVTIEGGNP